MNSAWFDEQISREFTVTLVNGFTTILDLFSTIFTSFMDGMQLHERSVCEKKTFFISEKCKYTPSYWGRERALLLLTKRLFREEEPTLFKMKVLL